jgi:hypothetical protein
MDLSWAWTFSTTVAGPGRVVWVSKGDGTFGPRTAFYEEAIPGFNASFCTQNVQFLSLDINGDHRSDLLLSCTTGDTLQRATWMTNPDGGTPSTYSSFVSEAGFSTNMSADRVFTVGDTNGDGKGDLIWAFRNSASGTVSRVTHRASSGAVDQVTSIGNGIGAVAAFSYKPLTDATVYTKDSGAAAAAYPSRDLQVPLWVVSTMTDSNDIGGVMTHNYSYGGAKTNLQGRGFLGFRFINAMQAETGLSTRTDYRQDWPYLGLASVVAKRTASGGNAGLLERQTNAYDCRDFVTAGCNVVAGRRYFPYLTSRIEEKWDLNGAAFPTITTTQQFDVWGNPTQVVVSASDSFARTTTNTYSNDTVNWFLGRLTQSTVQSTTPYPDVTTAGVCLAPPPPTPPVTLTGIAPSAGPVAGGTAVTLTGTNFVAGASVTIGGTPATGCSTVSATSITCSAPAGTAGAQNVVVTQAGGSATLPGGFTYQGAPTLTGIAPAVGPLTAGTAVTLTGTNFAVDATVTIGGAAATSCSTVSVTSITCSAPAGTAGAQNVVVTQAGGSATLPGGFTYQGAPTLTGIAPAVGPLTAGTAVTLTGTNFAVDATVTIGGAAATSCSTVSATSITCTAPAGTAGAQNVVVTQAGGSATLPGGFTYQAAPTLTGIVPAIGPLTAGTAVTLTGTNFVAGASVTIGGTPATGCSTVSATSITCSAPAGTAGAQNVVVTQAGGSATLPGGFTYQVAPTLASITPVSGPATGGTIVTMTGSGFASGATVSVGGVAATGCTVTSAIRMTCTAPANSVGAKDIVVTTAGGSASLAGGFTYTIGLTAVSPASGPATGGTTLTLTGSGFATGATLSVGGVAATSCTVTSPTRMTCVTPENTVGAKDVVVTTGGGSVTRASGFTYTIGLTGVSPSSGPATGGTTVTLTGSGFGTGATATIGGIPATGCTVTSPTKMTCVTPASTVGAKDVVVTTGGGNVTRANGFTYRITLSQVTPTSGPAAGGTTVTLTGTGFASDATATIGGVAATGCTVASATSMSCVTPANTVGAKDVVVTSSAGSVTRANGFTYKTTLTGVSPASGPTTGGTTVTLTGSGFASGATATIGGVAATSCTAVSSTSMSCVTPAGTIGLKSVVVTSGGSSATLANSYRYVAP